MSPPRRWKATRPGARQEISKLREQLPDGVVQARFAAQGQEHDETKRLTSQFQHSSHVPNLPHVLPRFSQTRALLFLHLGSNDRSYGEQAELSVLTCPLALPHEGSRLSLLTVLIAT
jgi:hypothetical protein